MICTTLLTSVATLGSCHYVSYYRHQGSSAVRTICFCYGAVTCYHVVLYIISNTGPVLLACISFKRCLSILLCLYTWNLSKTFTVHFLVILKMFMVLYIETCTYTLQNTSAKIQNYIYWILPIWGINFPCFVNVASWSEQLHSFIAISACSLTYQAIYLHGSAFWNSSIFIHKMWFTLKVLLCAICILQILKSFVIILASLPTKFFTVQFAPSSSYNLSLVP